jgi:hypothetical protein
MSSEVHFNTVNASTFFSQQFAQLLQAPHEEAQMIIKARFPVPRLVVCDQHGSQVCHLCLFLVSFSLVVVIVVVVLCCSPSLPRIRGFNICTYKLQVL